MESNGSKMASMDRIYPPSPEFETEQQSKYPAEDQIYSSQDYLTSSNQKSSHVTKSDKRDITLTSGANSPTEFITWNESKYGSSIQMENPNNFDKIRMKNEIKMRQLAQPIVKHKYGSNRAISESDINPNLSGSQNLGYDSCARIKYKPPKSKSKNKKRGQNILAYSLLDKSIENTMNLIESAKHQNLENNSGKLMSSMLGSPGHGLNDSGNVRSSSQFKLKDTDRDEKLMNFHKMQDLKVSNEELY